MSQVYSWGHSRRFNDYSNHIKKTYGERVQKISVNVGFSCPNRDGSKGVGGCIYCDNATFKPGYCKPEFPVEEQINKGISFFENKYPEMKYMAYFQSYTNTYAPVEQLRDLYVEALGHSRVVGLVIGTRPDCVNEEIIQMLAELKNKGTITIEFGVESTNNETLQEINRCHSYEDVIEAVDLCTKYGINVGVHLILGLPHESEEMMLEHAKRISKLPIHFLKLHQLQVTTNTVLAKRIEQNSNYVQLFTFDNYLTLVIKFIEQLNPDIVIERFVSTSPLDKLIAPKWNRMKNFEIVSLIEKELERQESWQGKHFNTIQA